MTNKYTFLLVRQQRVIATVRASTEQAGDEIMLLSVILATALDSNQLKVISFEVSQCDRCDGKSGGKITKKGDPLRC